MTLTKEEQMTYDIWQSASMHTNSRQLLQERHNMWINAILDKRTKTK